MSNTVFQSAQIRKDGDRYRFDHRDPHYLVHGIWTTNGKAVLGTYCNLSFHPDGCRSGGRHGYEVHLETSRGT